MLFLCYISPVEAYITDKDGRLGTDWAKLFGATESEYEKWLTEFIENVFHQTPEIVECKRYELDIKNVFSTNHS